MSRKLWVAWFCGMVFCFGALTQGSLYGEEEMKARSSAGEDKNNDNPFGVLEFLHWAHAWNYYKYSSRKDLDKAVALMKEIGVGWVRLDFLWDDIEPQPEQFDFQKYDYIVELLARNNIKILGLLDYSATWASPKKQWNYPAQDNRLFVSYAVTVARRYKDEVKYWEVWNEPDSRVYWARQDGLKSYCLLLKDVYTALKKVDPDCKVLNGGLANGIASVNRLYDNGARNYFDILNIHIFESPLSQDSIKRAAAYPRLAAKLMERKGDSKKKIWVTEIGSPGVKTGLKVNNWWLGENPDEDRQAAWLKEVYSKLPAVADKVFWAFFRDTKGHWDDGTDYFGLVRWDFSPKPAFYAYKESFEHWRQSH